MTRKNAHLISLNNIASMRDMTLNANICGLTITPEDMASGRFACCKVTYEKHVKVDNTN